jgi:hypothetical protein
MPSASQLADTQAISDDDVALAFDWYAETQACTAPAIESLGRIDPEFQIYFADTQTEIASIIYDVVSKRVNYSQVNLRIFRLHEQQKIAVSEIVNDLKERLAAEHQRELVEREEAAEEFVSAVGTVAVALATRGRASIGRLATRQSTLAREQMKFAARHPAYTMAHRSGDGLLAPLLASIPGRVRTVADCSALSQRLRPCPIGCQRAMTTQSKPALAPAPRSVFENVDLAPARETAHPKPGQLVIP